MVMPDERRQGHDNQWRVDIDNKQAAAPTEGGKWRLYERNIRNCARLVYIVLGCLGKEPSTIVTGEAEYS